MQYKRLFFNNLMYEMNILLIEINVSEHLEQIQF